MVDAFECSLLSWKWLSYLQRKTLNFFCSVATWWWAMSHVACWLKGFKSKNMLPTVLFYIYFKNKSIQIQNHATKKFKHRHLSLLINQKKRWRYVVHSISFQTFFVQAFKIVRDYWKFTMLLLYILWDDWQIFMISGSKE